MAIVRRLVLVVVFSRFVRNLIYADGAAGTKSDPTDEQGGGGGVTTGPILAQLLKGTQVAMVGRCGPEEGLLRASMQAQGVHWLVRRDEASPGGLNAVLATSGRPRILRVSPPPPSMPPTLAEDEFLDRVPERSTVFVITGSHEPKRCEHVLAKAHRLGIPVLVNASSKNLDTIRRYPVDALQVSASECESESPAQLARDLLRETCAQCVVVTCGAEGAYGICRATGILRYAPALTPPHPIQPMNEIGAGDAFMGAFSAAYLVTPEEIRLDRALVAGTISGCMHIMGLRSSAWSWSALRQFEGRSRTIDELGTKVA